MPPTNRLDPSNAKAIVARGLSTGLLRNGGGLPMAPTQPLKKAEPVAAPKSAITAAIECITPEMAKVWLTKNIANRKVKDTTVEAYARDMKHGKWLISHQSIAFDDMGNLLDGQHRLLAIIRAQVPVSILVIRDIPRIQGKCNTMDAVDRGVTRSIADQLGLHGYTESNILAGAAGILARICVGDRCKIGKLTVAQTLAIVEVFGEHLLPVIKNRSKQQGLKSALVLGVIAFCRVADHKRVDEFHVGLNTGADLSRGAPALVLRNWLMDKATLSGREKRKQEAEMVMHACHQFLEKKTIDKMVWNKNGVAFFRSKQLEKVSRITQLFL